MTSSPSLAAVLNPQSWDPDLLPPLQMDGFLTGTLLTPNLDVKWVAYRCASRLTRTPDPAGGSQKDSTV